MGDLVSVKHCKRLRMVSGNLYILAILYVLLSLWRSILHTLNDLTPCL